jgi:hypothetical protein
MRASDGVVPDPGPAEAGIRTRSSELPFRGYTLFFRYVNDEPCVVHIISSRRDLDGIVADD